MPTALTLSRRPLLAYVKSIKGTRDLAQVAWNFINDSLRTTIALQVRPRLPLPPRLPPLRPPLALPLVRASRFASRLSSRFCFSPCLSARVGPRFSQPPLQAPTGPRATPPVPPSRAQYPPRCVAASAVHLASRFLGGSNGTPQYQLPTHHDKPWCELATPLRCTPLKIYLPPHAAARRRTPHASACRRTRTPPHPHAAPARRRTHTPHPHAALRQVRGFQGAAGRGRGHCGPDPRDVRRQGSVQAGRGDNPLQRHGRRQCTPPPPHRAQRCTCIACTPGLPVAPLPSQQGLPSLAALRGAGAGANGHTSGAAAAAPAAVAAAAAPSSSSSERREEGELSPGAKRPKLQDAAGLASSSSLPAGAPPERAAADRTSADRAPPRTGPSPSSQPSAAARGGVADVAGAGGGK